MNVGFLTATTVMVG